MQQREKQYNTLEELTRTFKMLVNNELTAEEKRQKNWPKEYPISRPTFFRICRGDILTYEKIVSLSKHFKFGTPLIYI